MLFCHNTRIKMCATRECPVERLAKLSVSSFQKVLINTHCSVKSTLLFQSAMKKN